MNQWSSDHLPEQPLAKSGYADVHGLKMYYEMLGMGQPLVLLHGSLSTIETSFGKLLPFLARSRQVIAIEQQGHGHTADSDRPLSFEQMADDTAALLHQLGVKQADFFGYSMGAGIALQVAIRHPQVVRKQVLASVTYNSSGLYPELLAAFEHSKPEDLDGSPFQQAYQRVAPVPQAWPQLVAKVNQMDRQVQDWPSEVIGAIKKPTLLIIGDADIVRPEHTVTLFRLLSGGVVGDLVGLPESQLAVLPGTTHLTLVDRAEWLTSMIAPFLDIPLPGDKREAMTGGQG
jgi:pimeloyl-ACP methyl ester carboxylesterase